MAFKLSKHPLSPPPPLEFDTWEVVNTEHVYAAIQALEIEKEGLHCAGKSLKITGQKYGPTIGSHRI